MWAAIEEGHVAAIGATEPGRAQLTGSEKPDALVPLPLNGEVERRV
jgi:hypothetical protein